MWPCLNRYMHAAMQTMATMHAYPSMHVAALSIGLNGKVKGSLDSLWRAHVGLQGFGPAPVCQDSGTSPTKNKIPTREGFLAGRQ